MRFLARHWLLALALALIVAGYLLLASGGVTAAPLLLVAGYCLGLPLYLWLSFRGGGGRVEDGGE